MIAFEWWGDTATARRLRNQPTLEGQRSEMQATTFSLETPDGAMVFAYRRRSETPAKAVVR
jgi:hypothetical protein